jgi:hypothetical protein
MQTFSIPDEIKENYRYAIAKAREDRQRYFDWIKDEIETLIKLINTFDKVYVLGGLGSRLLKSTPTFYNQFLAGYDGPDKEEVEDELLQDDDEIEVLLEYAMSIATATQNTNQKNIPLPENIEEIYQQLSKIKSNMNFWELSAEVPSDGNEFDHWLRTNIMQESINVRGNGYHLHIKEIFTEMFQPHNGFLEQYYGFNAIDIYETIIKLDSLVYSKIGNPEGFMHQQKLFEKDGLNTKDIFFKFLESSISNKKAKSTEERIGGYDIKLIGNLKPIFSVAPKSEKEKLIFNKLAIEFGNNEIFFQPEKFKAFPLNDTHIKLRPLVKEGEKFYHFSLNLAFRNIFTIVEELIKSADAIYYENSFKGNSNASSKDNYIENKTKQLFEKLVPTAIFYHSLYYSIIENGEQKKPELDVIGISEETIYIIEVKAGELNTKHRRGAMKGLKDRLKETINEGSYQCHRALKYITENQNPTFEYVKDGKKNILVIDKAKIKSYFKISVTFEHFSSIAANLKYLISSGVLSPDFKWTWIVSIYDLMVFADLIQNEADFKEYLTHRIELYDRNDIEFLDELDILGFYFEGNFPLNAEKENEILHIVNYKDDIDAYYTRIGVGMPGATKPTKKKK